MTTHRNNIFRSRHSRRSVAKGAAAFGLGTSALAHLGPTATLAHQGSPEASPAATQELDLANLSPDIADPSEPVTISFASWHTANSPAFDALREQFQELHPNI